MPRNRRRGASEELNPWPGFVDALSTLLMVIIFVLLVFVLAQAFLSVALTGRDRALDKLNRQVAELSDMLSLERSRTGELQLSAASLGRDLQTANSGREQAARDLATLRSDSARIRAERDAMRAERDRLSARLADAELQAQSALARNTQLQARVTETGGRTDAAGQETATVATQLADTRRQLAQSRAELARLTALRDELEQQVKDAAVRATTEEQRRQALAVQLADQQKLSESGRAQIALLTQQMSALRDQMQKVSAALDLAEAAGRDQNAQIANLSTRLNTALASKVEELQRYRSEFFGRLRDVLQNRQDVQVVGDRFVFQSEVLFPAGSADMSASGQEQIRKLATTLKQIAAEIPPDVNWLLRVDGHADRQPRRSGDAGNWELSAQRAINVVKLLVDEGIPASRLAATGFGEYQPLDTADTAAAYARNRRIELRLTDR
ncbi:MAG: peptidoglycan -binding protein [Janthinobacterium lividum]